MEFFQKAKAQMRELQDEFGSKANLNATVSRMGKDLENKLNFMAMDPHRHSNASNAFSSSTHAGVSEVTMPAGFNEITSGSSTATGSSFEGTPKSSSIAPSEAITGSTISTATTENLSVIPNSQPGAPAAKLPLTARKSVRDDFESKKDILIERFSKALGTPWSIYVDLGAVYSYAMEERTQARDNPGRMLYNYFDSTAGFVEKFVTKFGTDGQMQLNKLASSHTVTLAPALHGEIKKGFTGCDIRDGKLRILFLKDKLGQNTASAATELGNAVTAAEIESEAGSSGSELSLAARNSVRTIYEVQVGAVLNEVRTISAAPTLEFVPNFTTNYTAIRAYVAANGDQRIGSDWDSKFGESTLRYFSGFARQLERQKFSKDSLLQEGFQDSVDKLEVQLRVVSELGNKKKYNDCVIEGGVLHLRTTPEAWRANAGDAAEGLLNML